MAKGLHIVVPVVAIAFGALVARFVFERMMFCSDCDPVPPEIDADLVGGSVAVLSSLGFFLTALAKPRIRYVTLAIRALSAFYWLGLSAVGVIVVRANGEESYQGLGLLPLGGAMFYYLVWLTYVESDPGAAKLSK